jgi:hypothetical protein
MLKFSKVIKESAEKENAKHLALIKASNIAIIK